MKGVLNGQGGGGFPLRWKNPTVTRKVAVGAILKDDPIITIKKAGTLH